MGHNYKIYLILLLTASLCKMADGQVALGADTEVELGTNIQHYPYLPVEGIGFVQRADLEKILQTPVELRYNNSKILNVTLFESISKFIVPYESSDTEKLLMLQTLKLVMHHNLKMRDRNGKVIQIMISITPKGNILDDLSRVSDIINHTNTKLPGTISTLLLHYGSLRLNSEAIPLIREDIEICNRFVKIYNPISNLICGVVLDSRNCGNNAKKLESLNLFKHNLVILDPRENNEDAFNAKITTMVPCVLAIFWKVILGLKQPIPITVDMKTGRFDRQPHLYSATSRGMKFYVQDIQLMNVDDMTSFNNSVSSKYHILTEEWLRRPVPLSKHHLGVTVHPSMVTVPQIMILQLLGTFRTIVIECPGLHSTKELSTQYDLARNIASIAKQLTSRETINNDQHIFDDGIPVQIILSLTIYHSDLEVNKRHVDDALSAARKINKIYSGMVKAIVFNWNSCLKSELCEPVGEEKSLAKYVYKHFKMLETVFMYALETRNSTSVQLGISFDQQLISDSTYYLKSWDAHFHASLFSKADLLVYKINIDENEILEQGALKSTQSFIPKLIPVKTVMQSILQVFKLPIPVTSMYQIKISGCKDKTKGGSIVVEQTKVAEYARFWEILNNYAIFENASMIIDTAFEAEEYSTERKCHYARSPFKGPKGCACGWWRVTRSNPSSDDTEGHYITLTDKKMIALQLYEAKLPQKFVPPQTTLNSWSISALIIVAVLIAITVSVFAARLGQRHRRTMTSNIVLTRKDLNDFFKGDANQLSKLECDLHQGSSGHADSQPYKKEMYELTLTSFKIGTRCLGKGEFGVVFSCTLLRDKVEKLVAVKMISNRTHSIGDQAHGRYLALKGLISEIKLMSYVGEHVHLVKLEGAYTAKLKKGKVMVFTEYCEMGSLENYLRNYLNNDGDAALNSTIENLPSELSNDLHRWAGEIALGMEFLASKNVVHADLASRNVLLNSQKCAKVSDFGLSRRLYDYSEYLKTEQGPLPWRWMAPESLRRMIFNEKTDVWSFGVTLWEMYTLGDMPYPGLSWDVNFPAMLDGGIRLHEPRWNEQNMYSIMKKCWQRFPDDRPQFSEIYSMVTYTN